MSVNIGRERAEKMIHERMAEICDTYAVIGFVAGTQQGVAVSYATTDRDACALNNLLDSIAEGGGVANSADSS